MAAASSGVERQKLDRLRALLAADPGNPRLWQTCADLAAELHDFGALEELARARLDNAPADAHASFALARALVGLERHDAALEVLAALNQALPHETAIARNLALCHYVLGGFEAAKPLLDACYAAGERDADLLRLLVSTYHHLGLVNEAVAVAKDNADAARDHGALAGVYALLYLDADDPVRAARYTRMALAANPDSVDGLVVQGTLQLAELRLEDAQRGFERVLEREPANGRAWVGLGTAALLERDFPAAKAALRRGLEQLGEHVGSWHLLAWTELVTGEVAEAQRLFEHALALDRNFSESHGALASVAALRGDRATAEREIEIANRLDAECLSARFAASVLLAKRGQGELASQLILDAIDEIASQRKSPLTDLLARLPHTGSRPH